MKIFLEIKVNFILRHLSRLKKIKNIKIKNTISLMLNLVTSLLVILFHFLLVATQRFYKEK